LQKIPVAGLLFRFVTRPVFPPTVEYGDIVKGLPIGAESCDVVYCSHVLEHLAVEDFRVALLNTHRYLKPAGIFRFALPDLERLARAYLESQDPSAAFRFMERTHLGLKVRKRGIAAFLRSWLGGSVHLWMWDCKAISVELERAGFRQIRRACFGDSINPWFAEVEDKGRWEGCLGVECVK
jgi:SAM-dependent methyltransferase